MFSFVLHTGMSLSVLNVDDSILDALDSPTQAPAWPSGVAGPRPPTTLPVALPIVPQHLNKAPSRPQELTSQGRKLEAAIQAGAMAVLNLQDSLNDWDSKVGDGDCGTTVSAAAMN
jgi:dihydroxyacetone kinase